MSSRITVTNTDHTPKGLQDLARKCNRDRHARRLRAVALRIEGWRPGVIAKALGTTAQSIRDWTLRYNDGGPEALRDAPRSGRPRSLGAAQWAELRSWVDDGPDRARDGVSRWRLKDLADKAGREFGIGVSLSSLQRGLKRMGYSWMSPRPRHPKADFERQQGFRDDFRAIVAASVPTGTDLGTTEVWFQDEARAGQKGMTNRIWARTGSRPKVVCDHRYGYGYLFAAACPERDLAVSHVCDRADTAQMNRHLQEISKAVETGAHAVLVLDGAGWHKSHALDVPANLSLVHLPPYSPELNSMEQVFQFLKSNYLSN